MKDLPYITIGRFSVLFIILLLSTTTIAQNREMKEYNVDSTLYVYYQQCKANIQSPIVLPMSDTLFTMAQTKSDPRMQAVALSTKLDYYYFKGQEDSIIAWVERVKKFAQETEQSKYYYFAWGKRLILFYIKKARNIFSPAFFRCKTPFLHRKNTRNGKSRKVCLYLHTEAYGYNKMIDRIKNNPRLKQFVIGLISPHRHPRPRLWVRWFVNPFVHKKGRGALIRRHARLDVFPWRRFEVGRDALIEDYAVVNNGAGDVVIGDQARIGIGSMVIGPVRLGDRAGLGQHVFISGFNHGYADGTRDSNAQELVRKEVTIGRESHIGANSVVVAGVTIGERCQVGAGSVVTKDIPSYSVAVGNPARVIKRYDAARAKWIRVDE